MTTLVSFPTNGERIQALLAAAEQRTAVAVEGHELDVQSLNAFQHFYTSLQPHNQKIFEEEWADSVPVCINMAWAIIGNVDLEALANGLIVQE